MDIKILITAAAPALAFTALATPAMAAPPYTNYGDMIDCSDGDCEDENIDYRITASETSSGVAIFAIHGR